MNNQLPEADLPNESAEKMLKERAAAVEMLPLMMFQEKDPDRKDHLFNCWAEATCT